MNRKERKLWILLTILFLIIGIVICIVVIKKYNIKAEKNEIENNLGNNGLKNQVWLYNNSYFYDNNEYLPAIFDTFSLEFFDSIVRICFKEECSLSNYEIDKNILSIESTFVGRYVISFENNYLVLEYFYEEHKLSRHLSELRMTQARNLLLNTD